MKRHHPVGVVKKKKGYKVFVVDASTINREEKKSGTRRWKYSQ